MKSVTVEEEKDFSPKASPQGQKGDKMTGNQWLADPERVPGGWYPDCNDDERNNRVGVRALAPGLPSKADEKEHGMRKVQVFLAAGFLLALGIGGEAQAATASYSGSIGLQIATLSAGAQGNGNTSVNGSGGAGSYQTQLQSFTLPLSDISTVALRVPVTDPAAAPIGGLQVTVANGSGSFTGGPAAMAGTMPLLGNSKVCLFGPCSGAAANITVPLTVVGQGGTTFASVFVNVTVTGAAWTVGPVAFGTTTTTGFAHGAMSGTVSTASNSGALRLVTPVFISTNIPASAVVPSFGFLDVHFGVPEPGTVALFASGIATFILLGRNRRR